MYEALFQRIKSTDFPLQCRGMYYFVYDETKRDVVYRQGD